MNKTVDPKSKQEKPRTWPLPNIYRLQFVSTRIEAGSFTAKARSASKLAQHSFPPVNINEVSPETTAES